MERAITIPITNDINVAISKVHVLGLINNCIKCMACQWKTTYSSTMLEIIVTIIRSNIHLSVKDSPHTKVSKICSKCKAKSTN